MRHNLILIIAAASLAACTDRTDADYRAEIADSMHTSITNYLAQLVTATRRLQTAAPLHAWDPLADDAAIMDMRDAWREARVAWENVEGAIAPMFAGLNETMDARYEDFLSALALEGERDKYLFDGDGVIGMHAIERILFAPTIRQEVVQYEETLDGYQPASYPVTDIDAIAFKTQLAQRLVDDATELASSWRPEDVDIAAAYKGLIELMGEQQDKVDLSVHGQEESRYSSYTLLDLRNNLTGTHEVYNLFRDWIHSKSLAQSSDRQILTQFDDLMSAYLTTPGYSLPNAPADWQDDPSPDALRTPFGVLWQQIRDSVDPMSDGSVVSQMSRIAGLLGFDGTTGVELPHVRHAHARR